MPNFWHYLGGSIIRPRSTWRRLLDDPRRLLLGTEAALFIGVLYTFTVLGLAVARVEAFAPPMLSIPAADYYSWEVFFAMLVTLLDWVLAAGLVHLLSKPFRGAGTFENTLAVLGFAVAVPMFVTWIPETVGMVLMLAGVMTQPQWLEMTATVPFWQVFGVVYQVVAVGWLALLFPVAAAVAQRLRWWQALLVGIVTVALFMAIMFIFIR